MNHLTTHKHRVSSIQYRVSSIEYRVSSIENPVSSIQYRVSSIEYPVSSIQYRVSIAQKELIMQNKPNFPNTQMNISTAITMDYVNIRLRSRFKNKAKQTQFKANSNPIKAIFTPDTPKTNPIKPNFKPVPRSGSTVFTFPFLLFTYFPIRAAVDKTYLADIRYPIQRNNRISYSK